MAILTDIERKRCQEAQGQMMRSHRPNLKLMRSVCVECIYDPLAGGTARAQIAACTVESCPLHPVRHFWSAERGAEGSGEE